MEHPIVRMDVKPYYGDRCGSPIGGTDETHKYEDKREAELLGQMGDPSTRRDGNPYCEVRFGPMETSILRTDKKHNYEDR